MQVSKIKIPVILYGKLLFVLIHVIINSVLQFAPMKTVQ